MARSGVNPFDPNLVSGTLYAYSALFAAQALNEVKKTPERSDSRGFEIWFELFSEWLAVYIRKTLDGLSSIADLERRIELSDVLKATLKPAEVADMEPAIKKMLEDFKKIQDLRNTIREQNAKFNDSYMKSGSEVLKMSASQPEMGRSQPMVRMLETQNTSERQINVSVKRLRELEEKLRADAKTIYESLARRVTPEKAREIEEKVEQAAKSEPSGGGR